MISHSIRTTCSKGIAERKDPCYPIHNQNLLFFFTGCFALSASSRFSTSLFLSARSSDVSLTAGSDSGSLVSILEGLSSGSGVRGSGEEGA